jgi:hypothetical protein
MGKGDAPRNNWGARWYSGYAAIKWHQPAMEPVKPGGRSEASAAYRPSESDADLEFETEHWRRGGINE